MIERQKVLLVSRLLCRHFDILLDCMLTSCVTTFNVVECYSAGMDLERSFALAINASR